MSAIAGIVHTNDEPVSQENINKIMESLLQFPADDIKVWKKENVFLGCHAQWITPESINEPLPFYDSERDVAITADAIIDNRDELFDMLQVDRTKRKEMPDSQLILLSYYKWGEESPKHLIGDFAFMIWDEKKQKLFGARDFSGSRTLYYYHQNQKFVFCTIIESLLTLPYIKKQLNEEWLAEFLAISGVVDTGNVLITPYKNITQVPPSHSISIVDGKIIIRRYCTVSKVEKLKLKSNGEYVEAFQEVFQKAVKSRLRTFHQVGSHLSGGLDSGSVVSFASRLLKTENKKIHTFSYIPPNDFKDFTPNQLQPDERPFIKSTVNFVGGINDHYLDFEGKDSYSEIDDLLDIMEMPYKFFENSFWQKGIFEKAQEEGVGVILNGGRGNLSISWGSALDYYSVMLKKLKWIKLYQELNHYSKNVGGGRLRRLPTIAKIAFPRLNNKFFKKTDIYKFPTLISEDFAMRTDVFKKLKEYGIDKSGWFSFSNIFAQRKRHFEDVFHWNASSTKATKMSLRYSVWERDPTNDLRVIRFCLSVPEEQYVQNGLDRALIRRATAGYLPDEVRLNQRIRGIQGSDWVHRMIPYWKTFIDEIERHSKDERILKYLNGPMLKESYLKFKEGLKPEYAMDPNLRVLMRSLIVSRFLNKFN